MSKKTIITVQHTESEHHLNGHAGAWGNWNLTVNGREQAYATGKWLQKEGCGEGYIMYCSDLARAVQTAEEINKTLNLTPVMSKLIREVNAGEGNGKPWDWYDEKILIVSHGCLLGFLQAMLMGFEFEDLRKARFSGRSGSVSKFEINDEGRVTAAYINRRAY